MKRGRINNGFKVMAIVGALAISGCAAYVNVILAVNRLIIDAHAQRKYINPDDLHQIVLTFTVGWLGAPIAIAIIILLGMSIFSLTKGHTGETASDGATTMESNLFMHSVLIASIGIIVTSIICAAFPAVPVLTEVLNIAILSMGIASGAIVAVVARQMWSGPGTEKGTTGKRDIAD